jgi:hypothetical protein
LAGIGGRIQRNGVGRLKDGPVAVAVGPPCREAREEQRADRRDRKSRAAAGRVEEDVAADPEERDEEDETDEEPGAPPEVPTLLVVEVGQVRASVAGSSPPTALPARPAS